MQSVNENNAAKIYTPEQHICICEVVHDEVDRIYLRFKKSKNSIYEYIPLDSLLEQIYQASRETARAR